MRELAALGLDGDVEELYGSGLCAIPGLVDCHTHPAFLGDRVDEFALRAGGASYEELHAAGGGILSTVRATRAGGEGALAAAVRRHADWMLRAGTTTFEGKSGYGLDRDTELASLEAVVAADGVPTWLGAHAVPPEFVDADAYLDFALAEVLPRAAELAVAADVFVEEGGASVRARWFRAHASMAKAFATVRMRETVGWARELMGGNGILLDHHVGRFVADADALYSYEGTREVNTLIVGRAVTGHSAIV